MCQDLQMLSAFKEPPVSDRVSFTYTSKILPLLSTSVDGVERCEILLGCKCEPRVDGVCLKVVPGRSYTD